MERKELYALIKNKFSALPQVKEALDENVTVCARSLSPEEAIGITERKDYPILTGNDVMIEAQYKGSKGQAFTDAPSSWSGSLSELFELDTENDPYAQGLLIATINAVMGYYGLCDRMVHCKNDGPKKCGPRVAKQISEAYGDPKTLIIGYQPSIIENMSVTVSRLRVLDLNPENIGHEKFGLTVENGADAAVMRDAKDWAELILCTGSTVCNGTLADYIDTGKETLFYGTTLAGVAALLDLKRICFSEL